MAALGSAPPWYLGLKAAVFALLACNTIFYLFAGTLNEALDAAAWLTLLALFELETGFAGRFRAKGAAIAIRGTRFAAAAAVGTAGLGYIYQHEWLNAINTGLWIAVIVLLELEVRYRDALAERPVAGTGAFAIAAVLLYTGLGILVLVWTWRRQWFDAYDAALWLTAFAMIEMDVLQISPREMTV